MPTNKTVSPTVSNEHTLMQMKVKRIKDKVTAKQQTNNSFLYDIEEYSKILMGGQTLIVLKHIVSYL